MLPDGDAMLMRPNKAETAVHGCHCPGDMAVRMGKVLARPLGGVECIIRGVTCFYFCLYISLLILTLLNGSTSVKTSLINTKLGDFVNLGVFFF